MAHHAVRRSGLGVHADEERSVASLLEQLGVLRPVVLNHVLTSSIELVRDERVEGPLPACAVAVHDDDLGRACRTGTTHRRIDLLGVQLTPFVIRALLLRSVRLLPLDDPGDAFHVADDEDLHEPA